MIALTAFADHSLSFRIGEVFDALLGAKVELAPVMLVSGVDETEGVAAETVHMTIRSRNTAVTHDHSTLMERFGKRCPEIPVVFGAAQIGARIAMYDMIEVRELERVAKKEDRSLIAYISYWHLCIVKEY